MDKIRVFHKTDLKTYYPKGIFWEDKNSRVFMLEGGRLVQDDDCIIMHSTGMLDVNGKEIYSGDIARLLDPNSMLLGADKTDIGFVMFKKSSAKFQWVGFNYDGFPEYSLSGKVFEIIGNLFDNRNSIYKRYAVDTDWRGMHKVHKSFGTENGNIDFIKNLFLQNDYAIIRRVITEKYLGERGRLMGLKKREAEREDKSRKYEAHKRMLGRMAEARKRERYMKIYEMMKQEIDGGKACDRDGHLNGRILM